MYRNRLSLFPDTAALCPAKDYRPSLHIGGCDLNGLAAEFGTPLYIYDQQTMISRRSTAPYKPIGMRSAGIIPAPPASPMLVKHV